MQSSTMPQSVIRPAAHDQDGDDPSGHRSDAVALPDTVALAAMVGSRLCHDLVSPLGAIGNGVELIEMALPELATSPEMSLINDSLKAARARLDLYRMAFGQAGTQQRLPPAEVQALITGLADGSRLDITLGDIPDQPRREVRVLMLALMCLQDSMPWGGRVVVAKAGGCWRLVAEAERMKPDSGLWAWLDGARPALRPSEVQFAVLAGAMAQIGRTGSYELDATGAELRI